MTARENYSKISAELDAARAEYDAAVDAYEAYEQEPGNWKAPDYTERLNDLRNAQYEKAAKTREIGSRLKAAQKAMFDTDPAYANMRSWLSALTK